MNVRKLMLFAWTFWEGLHCYGCCKIKLSRPHVPTFQIPVELLLLQ